jgi:hypothetical protein
MKDLPVITAIPTRAAKAAEDTDNKIIRVGSRAFSFEPALFLSVSAEFNAIFRGL